LINFETLLLCKKNLDNIIKTCVFALVFNVYIKNFTISAIKNIKCVSIYVNFFATNENDNNKKEAIFFCAIALITSIIKKYKNCILNFAFREFIFFFNSNASNIN